MKFLKQNTAITVKIGPFVDQDDGYTPEGSLTIAQADVRLTKNGGNFAQKNDTGSCTHDENGYYDCDLNATDVNTRGRLRLAVNESGALPVFEDFVVLDPDIYDMFFSNNNDFSLKPQKVSIVDNTASGTSHALEIRQTSGSGGNAMHIDSTGNDAIAIDPASYSAVHALGQGSNGVIHIEALTDTPGIFIETDNSGGNNSGDGIKITTGTSSATAGVGINIDSNGEGVSIQSTDIAVNIGSTSDNAVDIEANGAGKGLVINADNDLGMEITSNNAQAVKLESLGGIQSLIMNGGIDINGQAGNTNACIEIHGGSSQGALKLYNNNTKPTVDIDNADDGYAIDIRSNDEGAVYVEASSGVVLELRNEGSGGNGVVIYGGTSSGDAVQINARGSIGNSRGVVVDATDGDAVYLEGGNGGGNNGSGLHLVGASAGHGMEIEAGSSGNGIDIDATGGDGVNILSEGGNKGIAIDATDSGIGIDIDAYVAGIDITANEKGVDISTSNNTAVEITSNSGKALYMSGDDSDGAIHLNAPSGTDVFHIESENAKAVHVEAGGSGSEGVVIEAETQAVKMQTSGVGAFGAVHIESSDGAGVYVKGVQGSATDAPGIKILGDANFAGVEVRGGYNNGNAIDLVADNTTPSRRGQAIGANIEAKQDGEGAFITGGASGGNAVKLQSLDYEPALLCQGARMGAQFIGGSLNESHGISIIGGDPGAGATPAHGVFITTTQTTETAHGILAEGSNAGAGMSLDGGASGVDLLAQNADIWAHVIDGQSAEFIFKLVKAMVNGKYDLNTPGAGDITFYEDDNTTVLTVVNVTTAGRTRTSP